jgi:hypothetical protein
LVTTSALNRALVSWHRDWSDVFKIEHLDAILTFINEGIVHGMDLVAPIKRITVKDSALPLYLRPDTLALMARRDSLGRGPMYKSVRNRVTALVRCDKEFSNLSKLAESKNSPTVLWEIAIAAVGKPYQPLPGSVKDTEGNLEAANLVNTYYVKKVQKYGPARGESKNAVHSALRPPGTKIRGEFFLTSQSHLFCSPLPTRAVSQR